MVAVPGSCRTLSHLHFQRETQRLRCSRPGMGNEKRSAEIHYEVSLEAGAFLRSLLPFLPPTSRTEMQREPLRSTMCLGMQEIISTQGKAESEASSWVGMVSALVNYLWSTKVWDGRMSGKAIHRCSCGKSEMSKSWRKRSARMRHLSPLQRLRRTDG